MPSWLGGELFREWFGETAEVGMRVDPVGGLEESGEWKYLKVLMLMLRRAKTSAASRHLFTFENNTRLERTRYCLWYHRRSLLMRVKFLKRMRIHMIPSSETDRVEVAKIIVRLSQAHQQSTQYPSTKG